MRFIFAVLLLTPGVFAEDARLTQLRELLVPMRAEKQRPRPEFTHVKHLLRDWVEARIAAARTRDVVVREKDLNDALARAKLSCAVAPRDEDDPFLNWTGCLGDVEVEYQQGFLVVRTGVGIECGFDESAYAYRQSDGRWQRFWQSEQNDYRKDVYRPQTLVAVLISRGRPDPVFRNEHVDKSEHLILTLGCESWCMSNWHDVYYRVWQTADRYSEPKLLLTGSEWAWVEDEPPIAGTVDPDGALVEYIVNNNLSPGWHRPETRCYKVRDGRMVRVDPIAMGPRSFVAEWLNRPWKEAVAWTEPGHRAVLEQHRKGGEPVRHSMHCQQQDLWQVHLERGMGLKDPEEDYFLVRWRPPYHFTMVNVSDQPWPGCKQEDPEADEWRTMFQEPGWQWQKDQPTD